MPVYYILASVGIFVGSAVSVGTIRYIWRKVLRPKARGRRGETKIGKVLKKFSRNGGRVKNDLLIPGRTQTTQIDHVLVSKHGIFVVETKNYSGIVEGTEKGNMWRQFIPGKYSEPRYFFNPLLQNDGHIRALKKILPDNKKIPIFSIVVFPDACDFPKLPGVVSFSALKPTIQGISSGEPVLSDDEVKEIIQSIESNEITDKKKRDQHNVLAGMHSSSREEVEEFIRKSAEHAVRLNFDRPTPAPVDEKTLKRRQLADIFATLTIRGKTDTIDGFYEKAKRLDDGSPVPLGGNFDYFICPYTGDKFPASESINFYQGLWISYLNKKPELVEFMKEYGVENLGNNYRCKKALVFYDSDKDAFTQKVRNSSWYQNMAQKQRTPSLNSQIQSASSKSDAGQRNYYSKQKDKGDRGL